MPRRIAALPRLSQAASSSTRQTALRLAVVAGSAALACTACTSSKSSASPPATPAATTQAPAAVGTRTAATATKGAAAASASDPAVTTPPPNPASVHANELGLVPVMMYHRLVAHPTNDYERTPTAFMADLTFLDAHGFVPVTAGDFVAGKIDIPAGKHPVVFTFDDGTTSQFELVDGKPKAGTALALMQTFAASHPEFPAIATFFVNKDPFGSDEGKLALAYLSSHGDEVGVHTVDHTNLRTATDAKVQQEIAGNLLMIHAADPAQQVTVMALPFGERPKLHALAESGSSGGTTYHLAGVFAVGSNPSPSPYDASFDPFYIPRIRAEDEAQAQLSDKPYVSGYELPQLVADAKGVYTSDGDPAHVSYPKSSTVAVAAKWKGVAQPY